MKAKQIGQGKKNPATMETSQHGNIFEIINTISNRKVLVYSLNFVAYLRLKKSLTSSLPLACLPLFDHQLSKVDVYHPSDSSYYQADVNFPH